VALFMMKKKGCKSLQVSSQAWKLIQIIPSDEVDPVYIHGCDYHNTMHTWQCQQIFIFPNKKVN
jgi:hypothetical protein